jgi:hypothetical protein
MFLLLIKKPPRIAGRFLCLILFFLSFDKNSHDFMEVCLSELDAHAEQDKGLFSIVTVIE